jgi:rSAM/selenodomain-associated transferase 1
MATGEPVAVAILAKAPIVGFAKTRLVAALGAEGAATLQSRLIERAAATACAASVGPVTLWGAPDDGHAIFKDIRARYGAALAAQCGGDLGARMLEALAVAGGPALVIGTDCPALTPGHLRAAAEVLRAGSDAVIFPAEDGGYVLIGLRKAEPALFSTMHWSTPDVMQETRRRLRQRTLTWQEPATLWDVDVPEDLQRLQDIGLQDLIPPGLRGRFTPAG